MESFVDIVVTVTELCHLQEQGVVAIDLVRRHDVRRLRSHVYPRVNDLVHLGGRGRLGSAEDLDRVGVEALEDELGVHQTGALDGAFIRQDHVALRADHVYDLNQQRRDA